jgi:hypothetical protein
MLMLFLILALAPQEKRLPVPGSAEQKKAETLLKEIFKDEYSRKAPSDRLALARTMMKQASETSDDAAARYLMLRESKDLALQGGDWDLSLKAADAIGKAFEEDVLPMKGAILSTASRGTKTPAEYAKLSQASSVLADEAAAGNRFDIADKAAQEALSQAKLAKDPALAIKAEAKVKALAESKSKADAVAKAVATLAKSPDDPAANSAVGRHECLTKGAWKDGLPKLARGADPQLKEVATRDLAEPKDGPGRAAVGDGWWDVAEKESGSARALARSRAVYWYELALPGLSGLSKMKVERRIPELRQDKFPGAWVDITDARLFGRPGKAGEPIVLTPPVNDGIMAALAQLPEGVFDGFSARLRFKPEWTANGLIQFETNVRAFSIARAMKALAICALEADSTGKKAWIPKSVATSPDTNDYVVTVLIKGGEYVVYVNAAEVGRIATDRTKFERITIQADFSEVVFDQIKLKRKD